ncbi:hypothetical protein [Nocardioides zhouii]|uniref:Uncharacterized protein n=1 Tax=Nocardioides zhouii TaxID=1168729 RepID=A0A4Q2SXB3_9ACTN|nr:hypothetical protein [Nocardioides zhouii]RYC10816.1 hypothetical protein EUA94_11405 [Nocardioides zhouii]
MTKMSSTMFSVGTLLRHAQDTGADVKVLVEGTWMEGRVLGCDGLGAILDGAQSQFLVRLDHVTAVEFSRAQMDADFGDAGAPRAHGGASGPIEAGPVTVPAPSRGEYHFLTAKPY